MEVRYMEPSLSSVDALALYLREFFPGEFCGEVRVLVDGM
jgi:hypothetical protein